MDLHNTPEYQETKEFIANFLSQKFTLEELQSLDVDVLAKQYIENNNSRDA